MRAIVPIKRFDLAKQRLADCMSSARRISLARDMAERVLRELARSNQLDGVLVVSGEPTLHTHVAELGFDWLDDSGLGLNAALTAAMTQIVREEGDDVAIVHADLPLFSAAEFDRIASEHRAGAARKMTIVPDRQNDGTTIRFCRPADAMPPLYGPGSARRHCDHAAARGIAVEIASSATLSVDCDTSADLAHIRALGAASARLPASRRSERRREGVAP